MESKAIHESNSCILTWWMKHCPTMSRVLLENTNWCSQDQKLFYRKSVLIKVCKTVQIWKHFGTVPIESIQQWIDSMMNRFNECSFKIFLNLDSFAKIWSKLIFYKIFLVLTASIGVFCKNPRHCWIVFWFIM